MTYFYGFLCLLGLLLPYSVFLPWVMHNGLDFPLFFLQAFSNPISAFAWLDVVIAALALISFIGIEGKRQGMSRLMLWLPVLATLTVGVSFGLPLFLLLREWHLQKLSANAKAERG